jgi:hypothetical protein
MNFERRKLSIEFTTVEPTNVRIVKKTTPEEASKSVVIAGWEVFGLLTLPTPSPSTGVKPVPSEDLDIPHVAGHLNVPEQGITACKVNETYSPISNQQLLDKLIFDLRRHAQAEAYIASLASLRTAVEESRKTIARL